MKESYAIFLGKNSIFSSSYLSLFYKRQDFDISFGLCDGAEIN